MINSDRQSVSVLIISCDDVCTTYLSTTPCIKILFCHEGMVSTSFIAFVRWGVIPNKYSRFVTKAWAVPFIPVGWLDVVGANAPLRTDFFLLPSLSLLPWIVCITNSLRVLISPWMPDSSSIVRICNWSFLCSCSFKIGWLDCCYNEAWR